jgi:hypothetical protein
MMIIITSVQPNQAHEREKILTSSREVRLKRWLTAL